MQAAQSPQTIRDFNRLAENRNIRYLNYRGKTPKMFRLSRIVMTGNRLDN